MDSQKNFDDDTEDFENGSSPRALTGSPLVVGRGEHRLSRKDIDEDALKVMYRLLRHGYKAFLVGGGVRDLLLGKTPKDYDIGTDARPEAVRSVFRNSRIIGRRFRINHVYFHQNKIVEVATFRALTEPDPDTSPTMLAHDNTYGDPQSDALRRDLTINGLFYDLSTYSIIDYVGGLKDLKDRIVRVIGNPDVRFQEDPVRMIRAVRHAARTGFEIEPVTFESICKHRALIKMVPKARVYEEFVRELTGGSALESFRLLRQTGLLEYLVPVLHQSLLERESEVLPRLEETLTDVDMIVRSGKELPVSIIFPALLLGNFPSDEHYREELLGDDLSDESPELIDLVWDSYFEISPRIETQEAEDVGTGNGADSDEYEEHLEAATGSGHAGKSNARVHPRAFPPRREVTEPRGQAEERDRIFRAIIRHTFEPLGVSRKDRERIEQLLTARFLMFRGFLGHSSGTPLARRSYFDDALLLMYLTANDDLGRDCYRFWQEEGNLKRAEHPRRRGRSRGGRGGQNRGRGPRRR